MNSLPSLSVSDRTNDNIAYLFFIVFPSTCQTRHAGLLSSAQYRVPCETFVRFRFELAESKLLQSQFFI